MISPGDSCRELLRMVYVRFPARPLGRWGGIFDMLMQSGFRGPSIEEFPKIRVCTQNSSALIINAPTKRTPNLWNLLFETRCWFQVWEGSGQPACGRSISFEQVVAPGTSAHPRSPVSHVMGYCYGSLYVACVT